MEKPRGARLFGDSDGQSKASREAAITAVSPKKAPDGGLSVKRHCLLTLRPPSGAFFGETAVMAASRLALLCPSLSPKSRAPRGFSIQNSSKIRDPNLVKNPRPDPAEFATRV